MKTFLSFLVAIFTTTLLIGQAISLSFDSTIDKNGSLIEATYNSFIFKDSFGFTWISSIEGLNRFDGHTIKQYKEKKGLKDKNIQSNFFEDNNANIWFSTFNALNYYDRGADSIVQISFVKNATPYEVFYLDKNNNKLWLRVNNSVYWLNINDTAEFDLLSRKTDGQNFSVISNNDGSLKKIVAAPWFNVKGKGLEVYNIDADTLTSYHQYLNDYTSLTKSIHLKNTLWLLVTENKLLLFDEKEPSKTEVLKNTIDNTYWDAVKKGEDHLFIATKGDGLWYYNWKEDQIIQKWKNNERETSIASNSSTDLHLINNYLWVNMPKELGVAYAKLSNNVFLNLFEQPPINSFNTRATSVVEDENGNVWVGTTKNGVFVFSQTGVLLQDYRIEFSEIESSVVLQISKSQTGEIFIITEKKIFQFDKLTNSVKEIANSNPIYFRSMTSILPNRILLCTTNGIKELLKDEKGGYYISNSEEFSEYTGLSFLQLFQSSKRKLYVPYVAKELWIYKANKNRLEEIKKVNFEAKLYGFFESNKYDDLVWVATENGLAKIENDNIEYVAVRNSKLKNQSFYSVTEDNSGILWLTTNDGLWQYDPLKETAYKYETIDGLPNNSFAMYNGSILSSTGDVWLANNKGIIKFNPQNIVPSPVLPKVYIDKLNVNYSKEILGISDLKSIDLDFRENNLSFKIDAKDYRFAEKNIIHYRLLGHQNNWLPANPTQLINFAQLKPGDYNLELKVENNSGNFSPLSSLPINLKRSFWYDPLFWFAIGVLFSILTVSVYIQSKREQTQNAELKLQVFELEQKALRAQMNPHFLLNTLTSIKALLFENKAEQAATFFTKLSNLIDGVLDNSKKQLITLEKELQTIKLYMELEAFRFSNKFNFAINISDNVEESFVRIPPLILQPFVENSILHGFKGKAHGDGKISINVSRKGDFIICEIEDNGVGRGVKNTAIKSNGIGIQNTEKRIQLHHPKNQLYIIDLKDEQNKSLGTKVIIELYVPE